jgi:hypothetical protein
MKIKILMLDNKIFFDIRIAFRENQPSLIGKYFDSLLPILKESNYLIDKTYFHPLGFIYSKLFEFENSESLRLHIWDKERWYQEPLMDIHNHFYVVNSYIISGEMKNNLFQINNTKEPNYAVYVGSYTSQNDRILKKTNRLLNAEKINTEIIGVGNLYQITTDKLHSSSIPFDQFTCTLVYTANPGNPEPLVLGPLNGNDEYYYTNKVVEKEIITDLLRKIASR